MKKSYDYNMDLLFENMDLTSDDESIIKSRAVNVYNDIQSDLANKAKQNKLFAIIATILTLIGTIFYIYRFTQSDVTLILKLQQNFYIFVYFIVFMAIAAYFYIQHNNINKLIEDNKANESKYKSALFEELKETELINREDGLINQVNHQFNYLNDIYINSNDEITRLYTLIDIDETSTSKLVFNLDSYMPIDEYILKNNLNDIDSDLIEQNCQYEMLSLHQIVNYVDTLYSIATLKANQAQLSLQHKFNSANKKRKKVIELSHQFNHENQQINQQISDLKQQYQYLLNSNKKSTI